MCAHLLAKFMFVYGLPFCLSQSLPTYAYVGWVGQGLSWNWPGVVWLCVSLHNPEKNSRLVPNPLPPLLG